MLNRSALAASVIAALAVGGLAVATPVMAQVGLYDEYYNYAAGYYDSAAGYYDYAPGWGGVVANSNPSVPFDPANAALSSRYGKAYGSCGFTIAGC